VREFNTIGIPPSLERAGWIIVILSVITVLLVPSGIGPYSAVNGPTTVFKSMQHADAVKAAVSAIVLLDIRTLVSTIHVIRIATSSPPSFEWIDILQKCCVRLC
jgi:hypothetical protein